MRRIASLGAIALSLTISGCAVNNARSWQAPQFVHATPVDATLLRLPPPDHKVAVAVYGFSDQTGQFKDNQNVQTLSRAVTQGGASVLVKALQDAGNRQWFQAIERERLDDVLRERAVIKDMRQTYLGEKTIKAQVLPPLLFAGVILEGGIIGYDSNTKTGGLGARFLGIGGNVSYHEDTVTVYLRAVSTKTGEVLVTVNSRKSVSSFLMSSNTFKYVSYQDLLEVDAGFTTNEPSQLALQQAVEKAVYGLVMEGAEMKLWCFQATPEVTSDLLRHHIADRDHLKLEAARLPLDAEGRAVTGACSTMGKPTSADARTPVVPPPAPPPVQVGLAVIAMPSTVARTDGATITSDKGSNEGRARAPDDSAHTPDARANDEKKAGAGQ